MPRDLEAEQALLGALLLDESAFAAVRDRVSAEDFYLRAHQLVFGACCSVAEDGKPLDVLTVGAELEEHAAQGQVPLDMVASLAKGIGVAANVRYYAARVSELARLRRVMLEASAIINEGHGASARAGEFASQAPGRLQAAADHGAPISSFSSFSSSPGGANPALEPEALHGVLGEFVQALGPHTEADPAALLLQGLVLFGAIAGRGAYCPHESNRHHTNLYLAVVGGTAQARKGTAWGHIRRLGKMVDDTLTVIGGLSSGEGLVNAVRDGGGEDANGAAIPGVEDKRLLTVEGEFSLVLAQIERQGNTLSPILRTAWDGETLQCLTKRSPLKATGSHIAIIGHITEEELRRRLNSTEIANGFANRFLWACANRSKLIPEPRYLDDDFFRPYAERIRDALGVTKVAGAVRKTPEARVLWKEAYLGWLTEARPGLLGAITARAVPLVMRLALVYALLDGKAEIDREHLAAALATWRYCEGSCARIWAGSIGDPTADRLLTFLRDAGPDGLSRTQIFAKFHGNVLAADLDGAMAQLERFQLARRERPERAGPGRPQERWVATFL